KIVLQARKKSLSAGAQSALKPQLIFRCVVIVVVNSLAGIPWIIDHAIATYSPGNSAFSSFPGLPILISPIGVFIFLIFGSSNDVCPHVPFLSSHLNRLYIYIDTMAQKYSHSSNVSKTLETQSKSLKLIGNLDTSKTGIQ
ncbi:hypothetical protein ROZALSC1DRAFT_26335, partial [Rozella allomycis CSF55]